MTAATFAARDSAAPCGGTAQRITERQNQPDMLDVLRAKSAAYDSAQRWHCTDIMITVVVPLTLSLWNAVLPQAMKAMLVYAMFALFLDIAVLDRMQKSRRALGARLQQWFDCTLFGLPWQRDRVDEPLTLETIRQWARRHPTRKGLRGWYPAAVARLPDPVAAVVCQRANGNWSANVRERYASALRVTAGGIVLVIVAAAVRRSATIIEVGAWAGLATPTLYWLLRESHRQAEVAQEGRDVRARAQGLWVRMLAGEQPGSLTAEIREIQNDICGLRQRAPQMVPWMYDRFRRQDELEMQEIAHQLVEQYLAATGAEQRAVPRPVERGGRTVD